MMYYITVWTIGVGLIVWSFWYSHKVRTRRERKRFLNKLAGYRFETWEQLQAMWRQRGVHFPLDGKAFDENRHGNLLETLKAIDESACAEFGNWIE